MYLSNNRIHKLNTNSPKLSLDFLTRHFPANSPNRIAEHANTKTGMVRTERSRANAIVRGETDDVYRLDVVCAKEGLESGRGEG